MNPEPMPMPMVLVVDDNGEHCQALAKTFARARYAVMTASDGQEALEILLEQPFDLVITDLQMPRTNGLDLLGRIQAMTRHPAVLILTAFGDCMTYGEAMDNDCVVYLSKPVRREDVLLAARKALASRGIRTPRVSAGAVGMVLSLPRVSLLSGGLERISKRCSRSLADGCQFAPFGCGFQAQNCCAAPTAIRYSLHIHNQRRRRQRASAPACPTRAQIHAEPICSEGYMFVALISFPPIQPGKDADFRAWFASSNRTFAPFKGFLGRKLLKPLEGGNYAAIVECEDRASFEALHSSPEHAKAGEQVKAMFDGKPMPRFYDVIAS